MYGTSIAIAAPSGPKIGMSVRLSTTADANAIDELIKEHAMSEVFEALGAASREAEQMRRLAKNFFRGKGQPMTPLRVHEIRQAADDIARPVFEAMGKRITHLGPSGAGQLGKAANQILVGVNLMAVSEALAFAKKAGLPLAALHEALTAGAANSWALEVLGRKMIDRDFKPAFAIKHQQKDLAIVLKTSREKKLPLPGAALVHQLLTALEAEGRGDDGTQALFTLYEKLGGEGTP